MIFKKYIGDKAFYNRVLKITVPVLIQTVITNFVNLLDNLMVGRVGTEPMSGVAIVNQLLFVFFLSVIGAMSGPGIFMSQYYGKGDNEGIKRIFKLKFVLAGAVSILSFLILFFFGDKLIKLFLHESDSGLDIEYTFRCAKSYLRIMLVQIPMYSLIQVYASTLRETGEANIPMRAGIAAVCVNIVFNWLLIYGKLGMPALGASGAAVATVLSRVVELSYILYNMHKHPECCPYTSGVLKTALPGRLVWSVIRIGMPMLINELLWSVSMSTVNQCYSMRGLEAVSATNIASTVSNLFYCACMAFGTTVSIIIGQLLGAGETDRAIDEDRKLIAFDVFVCTIIGVIMFFMAPVIPKIYNTTDTVRRLAGLQLMVCSCILPFDAICNPCYFTLRAGGKTGVTFLFDSGFNWLIMTPVAFILSRYTHLDLVAMYMLVQSTTVLKAVFGLVLVKSKCWINNLVG